MSTVHDNKLALVLDLDGAQPCQTIYRGRHSIAGLPTVRDQLGVKMNCDLDGYQFSEFSEHYICREELPNGSNTFQQVLDEITEDLETMHGITIDTKPFSDSKEIRQRRKSIATPRYSQPFKTSNSTRKVHWGGTSVARVEQKMPPFQRPRNLSDGAIVGKGHRK